MIDLPASDIPHSEDGIAVCSDPQYLPIVDKAYDRPGGDEAEWMKQNLCRPCPIAAECLDHAMQRREDGVWGATSPKLRTVHGGPAKATVPKPRAAAE